jgi:transposase InsO family protein
MVEFLEAHREHYGVEPICAQLPIAPSVYYEQRARRAEPARRPPRQIRDAELRVAIERVWKENFEAYGAAKVWLQVHREGIAVARCTVERLMREMGLRGVVRGRGYKVTTRTDAASLHADLGGLCARAGRAPG